MATHSSILHWRILWTEEPGGLQSMGRKQLDITERTHILAVATSPYDLPLLVHTYTESRVSQCRCAKTCFIKENAVKFISV